MRFFYALLALGLAFGGPSESIFAEIQTILKAKCAIPVRLPDALPDIGQGSDRIYAIPQKVERDSYSIILGYTADCNGASFCRLGSLGGRTAAQDRSRLHGKRVRLAQGLNGFFSKGTCGAGCSDSTLEWQQEGAIYSAGLKGAQLSDLVPLANAVIESRAN